MIETGALVPDLTVTTVDGRPQPLSVAWRDGRQALLVFLRHLG